MKKIVNRAMAAMVSSALAMSGVAGNVMAGGIAYASEGSDITAASEVNSREETADGKEATSEAGAMSFTGNENLTDADKGGNGSGTDTAEGLADAAATDAARAEEADAEIRVVTVEGAEEKASSEEADEEKIDAEYGSLEMTEEEAELLKNGEDVIGEDRADTSECVLVETELVSEEDGYRITASGSMPEGAVLRAEKVTYTEEYRDIVEGDHAPYVREYVTGSGDECVEHEADVEIEGGAEYAESKENDEAGVVAEAIEESWVGYEERASSYTVYEAFDISIVAQGEAWQPVDDGEVISISIEGIEIPEYEEAIEVTRISDEEEYTTKLEAKVDGDTVSFETEHFTVFVIGSVTYNSTDATMSWDISAGQDGSLMAYWYEDDNVLLISGSGDMKDSSGLASKSVFGNLEGYKVVWDDKGITSIGDYMFALPGNLKDNTATFDELPLGIRRIGSRAFSRCTGFDQDIPEGVTEIGDFAFENCLTLKSGKLPEGLESLGMGAFMESGIESINIPSGISSVPENLCSGCDNLVNISLSENTRRIGRSAFSGLGKETSGIDIDFSNCAALSELAEDAFSGANPKTINLSGTSLKEMPRGIFDYSYNLESVTLPEGLTSIGDRAFEYCPKLKSVNFEGLPKLIKIGNRAFSQCPHLGDVNLLASTGLESIGFEAFKEGYSITAIRLPASVKMIGDRAFKQCHLLETIEAYGNADLGKNAFLDTDSARSGADPDYNYSLNGKYKKYKLPVKTNLIGDAGWFDTYDFKGDMRVVGDYTVTLPMSIDLTYDGGGFGDVSYSVENSTNGWDVMVSLFDTNRQYQKGSVKLSDGMGHTLMLRCEDITYSTDYRDNIEKHGVGESSKTITFTSIDKPRAEGAYRGTITFRTGILVQTGSP